MAHLSENPKHLNIIDQPVNLLDAKFERKDVEFIILPYYSNLDSILNKLNLISELNSFISKSKEESVIAILTSSIFAADFCSQLKSNAHLKLWIAIKLESDFGNKSTLNQHHCALLIITRYKHSLVHTKTRISYAYCETCEKTIKDYGGKKHLYHSYGTLMSDVWRDITVKFQNYPTEVVNRLADLFGLPQYNNLNIYDCRQLYSEAPVTQVFKNYLNINENKFSFRGKTGSQLFNDDCLLALADIPDNSVDFCFADPPYNIKKKYENWNDGLDILEYFIWCDKWLGELARILKPGRTLAVLNIPQWCIRHFKYLITILDYQDWIAWEGLSLPVRMIMPSHYSILCFSKGKPRNLPGLIRNNHSIIEKKSIETFNEQFCNRPPCIKRRSLLNIKDTVVSTNLWWDIHRLKHNSRRADHPCQLPPVFMYRLISLFTNEGEIVLDPFNGAGTSTLTAAQLNRQYIGIELSTYYHEISSNRHKELEMGLDPFRKNEITPKAKNSRVERLIQQKYEVSKKDLQLEVRQIAKDIGHIPTREEVLLISQYPIAYYDKYFTGWGEVTAAARTTGMSENHPEKKNNLPESNQLSIWQ